MLFNSFPYMLVFLPAAILLAKLARSWGGWRAAQGCVLISSVLFYGYAKPQNLWYLAGSILVNWLFGRWLGNTHEALPRRRILQVGLGLNVCFLCVFKYANLFFHSVPWLVERGVIIPDLEFPLGISFFTITQIMYLVNCHEGAIRPSTLFDHATFVSFFPYVVSGPISRAKRILHQFPNIANPDDSGRSEMARGVYIFAMGLSKKAVLSGAFAQAAEFGFAEAHTISSLEAWIFATLYALYVYFDFSGYSDMAIGSALMLGIHVSPNFDAPYQATSIIDFWQRWHISLTSFITNYLYTPLVRALGKRTWIVTSLSTVLAMSIVGLWHDLRWTFLIFGLIHGFALAINQNWRTWKMPKLPSAVGWFTMMIVVDVGFVFFHATTVSAAMAYLPRLVAPHHLFGLDVLRHMNGHDLQSVLSYAIQVIGVVIAFTGKSSEARARDFAPSWGYLAQAVALLCLACLFVNSNLAKPFVYFAF